MIASILRDPRSFFSSFARYAAFGSLGTAFHYAVLMALVERARMAPVLAATCGFAGGAGVNYLLNYRYTFRSDRPHAEALPRFLYLAGLGAVINAAMFQAGVSWLRLHYLVAQVIATGFVVSATYVGNRVWTFRKPGA